jgi:hypothetical protein
MTYHLTIFAVLVCVVWGAFLWLTAHPTPKPRQESRHEVLEQPQIEPQIEPEKAGETATYNGEELKSIIEKRDPFRRGK